MSILAKIKDFFHSILSPDIDIPHSIQLSTEGAIIPITNHNTINFLKKLNYTGTLCYVAVFNWYTLRTLGNEDYPVYTVQTTPDGITHALGWYSAGHFGREYFLSIDGKYEAVIRSVVDSMLLQLEN